MTGKRSVRGFTLVELLVVVAIVGILAAIGYPSFRKWIHAAKEEGEANRMLPAIGAAAGLRKAETLTYLGCSTSLTDGYPRVTPDGAAAAWSQPGHDDAACWRMLGVDSHGPVHCVYSLVAGAAGQTPPALPNGAPSLGLQSEPWYVALAACDVDGDGTQTMFWASSAGGGILRVVP